MSTKTFPVSIIKKIENEMGHNAPIRTISILIPSESISFGRNCIVLHNDIIRKIYDSPGMKLGSQIVGADSTHKILEKNGKAGPLKVFTFINAKGGESIGNASAHDIKGSVGGYVRINHSGSGVSIYGVSAMDGYHSMLLTYQIKDDIPIFTLIDQGPATSILTGKSIFHMAMDLDTALEEYVRDKKSKRTRGGHEYPANIQVYRIFPGKKN